MGNAMIMLAVLSLAFGWLLGQFYKVLVLIPAICVAVPVVFAASVSLGDTALQTVLKIAAAIWLIPVGYAVGQILFNLPTLMRNRRKVRAEGIARLRVRRD
jgi:hypothetical protein